ncbi:unnamed protein product [Haemonchus placei]|uniref:Uncharacterized protein n=1 Tax=Haemonchus placei TaxID=6290 RepID=A0A3P7UZZ8_HAEPC|nr:unnamed protein product [Haemonchus placei]
MSSGTGVDSCSPFFPPFFLLLVGAALSFISKSASIASRSSSSSCFPFLPFLVFFLLSCFACADGSGLFSCFLSCVTGFFSTTSSFFSESDADLASLSSSPSSSICKIQVVHNSASCKERFMKGKLKKRVYSG